MLVEGLVGPPAARRLSISASAQRAPRRLRRAPRGPSPSAAGAGLLGQLGLPSVENPLARRAASPARPARGRLTTRRRLTAPEHRAARLPPAARCPDRLCPAALEPIDRARPPPLELRLLLGPPPVRAARLLELVEPARRAPSLAPRGLVLPSLQRAGGSARVRPPASRSASACSAWSAGGRAPRVEPGGGLRGLHTRSHGLALGAGELSPKSVEIRGWLASLCGLRHHPVALRLPRRWPVSRRSLRQETSGTV